MKITRITLASKSVLDILVLYHSDKPDDADYKMTVSLNPAYHLTPDIEEELQSNNLVDEFNVPTKFGIWFVYNCGTSDAAPAFQPFVRKLTTKARHTLALFCIGELAKEHIATKNIEKKTIIEGLLNNLELFFTGTTIKRILSGTVPKEKSIEEIADSYDRVIEYNNNKHN